MAGLFAARALRAGRVNFDPFGERSSDEDDSDDDLEAVEEAPEMTEEEALKYGGGGPAVAQKARFEEKAKEVEAAFDLSVDISDESTASKLPPLTVLGSRWESPCEMIYEDDDAEVFCVRFSPDDTLVAAGCGDSVVRVFHCDDGRLAYNLERDASEAMNRMPLTCLRWRPAAAAGTKNVLLSANSDGTVQHWHVTSRKCLHTIKEEDENGKPNQVYALDYRGDATAFATAGKDYAVRVYDEATKSVTAKLASGWVGAPSAGHSNRVFTLKFVPDDPQLLLSGGWDNTVQIWDLRTSQPAASLFGPHICGDAIDVSGNEVLTGSWRQEKQLEIWDLRKHELICDVPFRPAALAGQGDPCSLYACQFSKPGAAGPQMLAAGGSGSNELKLFARAGLAPLGRLTLPRGVYGLDMSHDGSSVAVAGGDCKIRVLQVPGRDGGKKAPAAPAVAAAPAVEAS